MASQLRWRREAARVARGAGTQENTRCDSVGQSQCQQAQKKSPIAERRPTSVRGDRHDGRDRHVAGEEKRNEEHASDRQRNEAGLGTDEEDGRRGPPEEIAG